MPKITITCTDCNSQCFITDYAYKLNIRKNGTYLCHRCACIRAGANGKFSGSRESRSIASKKKWQSTEFRERITEASKNANCRKLYREVQCSRSKILWADDSYRLRVSESVKQRFIDDPAYAQRVSDGLKLKYASDPKYREAIIDNLSKQPKISSLQIKLYKYLDDLGIIYHEEGLETKVGYYLFDCFIPISDGGILIECQGDYWHSLPRAIRNDKSKFTYINRYFPEYEIMYIWEHEFFAKDRVLDRLKIKLKIDIETINFDFGDIVIEKLTFATTAKFLDTYHYIGKGRGGKCFGAYLGSELIAVIVFGHPIRQGVARRTGGIDIKELSRLCIHPSYHKKNFFSWFVSRAIKLVDADKIIAFADTTVGHDGLSYRATNFKLHHEVAPDYWYVDVDGYVMHKKTLYQRAKTMSMKESDFAEKYGYHKKWGGKKLCFVFDK